MPSLDQTLQALRSLDTLAAADTALTRRDPRAKLLTTLLFVGMVLSHGRHELAALLPLALYPLVLALQGQVPARTVLHTLLLAAPFALMVGAFNPLLEHEPMLVLGGVVVSGGWVSLAAIAVRLALTVSATVVLVAGTGMLPLCAALARLGVPQVLTVQLLFLHRYLFVLAGETLRMDTARRLRANGRRGMGLATYASLLGHLLLRAFDRAQRIHQAMLARGWRGELQLATTVRWQWADTLFLLGWALYFGAVRWLPVQQALVHLLRPWLAAVAP